MASTSKSRNGDRAAGAVGRGDAVAAPRRGDERIAALDILRFFAIAAVVTVHASYLYMRVAPMDRLGGQIAAIVHLLAGFGVPLFVLLSAVGLALRYREPMGLGRDYLSFLRRRASRLLPAYVLWSLVSAYRDNPDMLWPPAELGRMLLTGSADSQFYFIPLIFQLYLLWPLVDRIALLARRNVTASLLLAAAGMAVSLSCWQAHWWRPMLPFLPRTVVFWLLYITAGLALEPWMEHFRRFARSRTAIVILLVATAAGACYMCADFFSRVSPPYNPRQVTLAAMVFLRSHVPYFFAVMGLLLLVALRFERSPAGRLAARVGRSSYGIFLVHLMLMRTVLIKRVVGMPQAADFSSAVWILSVILIPVATLAMTYAFVAAAERIPAARRWVGAV